MTNEAGLEFEKEKPLPCNSEPDGMVAYSLAMDNPKRDDPTWPLPSFKATDWAEAFCKKFSNVPVDDAIAWFANALMRGYDEYARATPQPIDAWLPIDCANECKPIDDPIPLTPEPTDHDVHMDHITELGQWMWRNRSRVSIALAIAPKPPEGR